MVNEVDERYLSFAIDTAQITGGLWWEGSGGSAQGQGVIPTQPFDLDQTRIRNLTAPLAPAFLRVGGSAADNTYYLPATGETLPPHFESALTRPQWDRLMRFVKDLGLELSFTINAGPGTRGKDKAWTPSHALRLMKYAHDRRDPVAVWEFGNEPNGFFFIHGFGTQISAAQYARDFLRFDELRSSLFPRSMNLGPNTSFFPKVGELLPFFTEITPGFLRKSRQAPQIVGWHYYPTQSTRCPIASRRTSVETLLKPATLNEVRKHLRHVKSLRDAYAPGAKLWLSETGPAQCGGQPNVTDRFVDSFWWLDQLGTAALEGYDVTIRQTLVGADYGMIRYADHQPAPDYWASLLWKKLMGTRALQVNLNGSGDRLRAYAHCTPASGGSFTLLLVNLDQRQSQRLRLPQWKGVPVREFTITAGKPEGALSKSVRLNGRELTANEHGIPEAVAESGRVASVGAETVIPPLSYRFIEFPAAKLPACR